MSDARKRLNFICENCRSDEVTLDAWAEWDTGAQEWVLGATYDFTFCHKCQAETHLIEVELAPEPQD